jgi:ribosomal protein S27E
MAIKIIEENPVPRQQVTCQGCNSVLEYGNADLVEGRVYLSGSVASYKIKCPVCGVWIECKWIK